MIREWTVEEGRRINLADMTKVFDKETSFVKTEESYTQKKYLAMMESGQAHILVIDEDGIIKGALGFIIGPDLHEDIKVAIETFWFVLPEYRGGGKQLMIAFQEKAKELGCKRTAMIHLSDLFPDTLEQFYIKHGYRLAEKHYIREVV